MTITSSMTKASQQSVNQMDAPNVTYAPNPAQQVRARPASEQRPMQKGSGNDKAS